MKPTPSDIWDELDTYRATLGAQASTVLTHRNANYLTSMLCELHDYDGWEFAVVRPHVVAWLEKGGAL